MDDWFRNLLGELVNSTIYDVIKWLGTKGLVLTSPVWAPWAIKNRKPLIRRGKSISVLVADSVGVSDATTHALRGTVQGGGSMSGELSVGPAKKRSAAEELFGWYLRIHLS
jgi:hypothetical protein